MIATGTYQPGLVLLSILIAVMASFTALSLAGRVRASTDRARQVWLATAAVALGGGVWAMHFVAMLAFALPGMTMTYDVALTLMSLAIAIIFTMAGFALVDWQRPSLPRIAAAGTLMGAGIGTMHYVGMAAMRMPAGIVYDRLWVAISVAIAIGAASIALWMATSRRYAEHRFGAAAIMGLAIAGMHYAGMHAAHFIDRTPPHAASMDPSFGQTWLAALIGAVTIATLLMALAAARLARLVNAIARREARTALRLQITDILRDRTNVPALEEVAALLGAHFQVARAGYGQLDADHDMFDYDVCWTDGRVPPLLGRYPAATFGPKIVAQLNAGHTVAIDDLRHAPLSDDIQTQLTAREVATRAILVVPFVRDGLVRTIVYLNDSTPRRWDADDIAFMEEIAERTRLVIERAAAERQLRELNATLEARVEHRTAELRATQDALLQSQKMEAVGQLVSGLAHDFNNVLGAIVGAFDMMRRRADDPDRVRRFADAGLQAAERGAKLTAQLLTFARSQQIQLQPLYVCTVIDGLHDMLARTLGPLIHLDLRLNPDPVPVMADPTQIEMMVLNLVINARDAMPDGGHLTVATRVLAVADDRELAAGDYVEIAVTDTGTGMDEATQRRAMEPFFTTKPVGKGTGLGLAQIYGSARQAGGTVRIDSALGHGTTVRVLLPCTDQLPDVPPPLTAIVTTTLAPDSTVLLVDDDHDLRAVLASGLEAQGYRVVAKADGPSAIASLDEVAPDIAVLDFAMPGMNGAEVADEIAARFPALPILFASGYADIDAIRAVAGPDARLLRKPFRIDDLLQAVAATLAMTATAPEILIREQD